LASILKRNLQLVLLPGLGADERLLQPQREAFPDLIVPPWLPPRKTEGLPEYAARLAETLPRDRPLIVGGVSLGGMIAYELARGLSQFSCNENGTVPFWGPVKAVVLIASCCTWSAIRPLYRVGGVLWPAVPSATLSLVKCAANFILGRFSPVTATQRRMLVTMFRSIDNRFMHWAVSAILRWRPQPLEQVPVYHIHGARDRLIPMRRQSPTKIIPDGGHLINLTHAEAVNGFLENIVKTVASRYNIPETQKDC
jgi:pimeloyl-ACP methyl ester carboxylesterase